MEHELIGEQCLRSLGFVGPCVATKRYLNTMTWPPML